MQRAARFVLHSLLLAFAIVLTASPSLAQPQPLKIGIVTLSPARRPARSAFRHAMPPS